MPTTPKKTSEELQAELEKKLQQFQTGEVALSSRQLAQQLGIAFSDLKGVPVDPEALALVPEEQAKAAGLAVLYRTGSTIIVAVLDPRRSETKELLDSLHKKFTEVRLLMTSPDALALVHVRYESMRKAEAFEVGTVDVGAQELSEIGRKITNLGELKAMLSGASATTMLEVILAGALNLSASDVHFEPEVGVIRLRYRLDGLLHNVTTLEKQPYRLLLNRIKVLAKLKLNITKSPQDGRFTIQQGDMDIEVRVSILPSEYGESIVMRLLDPRTIKTKLEELGMRGDVLAKVKELLGRPQGALLTTGPTGSGKTTSLYAFVTFLNTPDVKIITVEDPIEYHIEGISQTQVDPDKGYTFASGLRAIVRQDPDVILIGEIRDMETAGIALNAALTGHLVLSTIHTNDAAGTIPRLVDIGIKVETIAPAVTMAMGQRLLRRLCPKCKKETRLSGDELSKAKRQLEPILKRFKLPSIDEKLKIYEPVGCDECNNLGYRGRIGVYEVFEVTREMERLILSTPSVTDVRDLAIKEGMVTMLQDGYLKLAEGTTSVEEIHRVLE